MRMAGAYVFLDVPSLGMSLQWDRGMRVYVKVESIWQGRVSITPFTVIILKENTTKT